MGSRRPHLFFLLPASLPLWALATGVALAAAPAPLPAATAAKVEAASADTKDAPKGAAKEAAKDVPKKDGELIKKDGQTARSVDKSVAKSVDKSVTKSVAKTVAKTVAKKDGPEGAPAEPSAPKRDGAAPIAGAGAPPPQKAEGPEGATVEEPAPPTGPPLKISALHEEMNRPPRKDEHATSRERLERLAVDINKAREALRQDTARLEAMLAARDAAVAPGPTSSAAVNDSGEPTKKIPSPLDSLAKAIRGMKPEQAAPILSRVDRKLAADVLLRMPGADAGKVMGVCKPEVAAELAAEIASRAPHAELKR